MDLNRTKWYVRWYFWSLGILDEFLENGGSSYYREQSGTNLCAFMRTILFSAPLVLLITIIIYAATVASVTVLPIYLFGWKVYGLILGAALIVLILISLGGAMLDKWEIRKMAAKEQLAESADKDANPSFVRIFWRWLGAKKQKVCPLVTFVKEDKEAQS